MKRYGIYPALFIINGFLEPSFRLKQMERQRNMRSGGICNC